MYIFWLETKFVLTVYGITLKHARMYWDIKTDDWLLRRPLLVYGGTEGSKEQIANSNGVDRCFKRMVIWQSFLALFNCWWIHPWSDVDIDARIFKTLCQKLTYVMCRKKHHNNRLFFVIFVCAMLTRIDWKFYVGVPWGLWLTDNSTGHLLYCARAIYRA